MFECLEGPSGGECDTFHHRTDHLGGAGAILEACEHAAALAVPDRRSLALEVRQEQRHDPERAHHAGERHVRARGEETERQPEDEREARETAARLGLPPSGNARAYGPDDEPLVRMRNTAILPGSSTIESMIEGVDDGYLLLKTGNGQADTTTEFMFGIELGYEIKSGKLGRAIRNTTVSGSALKVLQSVDAVGNQMEWSCNGYCGKKQPMVVSVGGPALRTRAHLGGE
mgnify:CR=1 FL=1